MSDEGRTFFGSGGGGGGLTQAAADARYSPVIVDTGAWAPSFSYSAGNLFTAPNGDRKLVTAAYTSGTSYGTLENANSTPLGQPLANQTIYGLLIGRGSAVVPIGLHAKVNGHLLSNGTDTSTTYRDFFQLTDSAASAVLVGYTNYWNNADVANANAITVACAVEHSDGTIIPFTWNGAHTVSVAGGGGPVFPDYPVSFGSQVATNDAATGNPLPLKGVWIRTYVTVSATQKWILNIDNRMASGANYTTGTGADLTLAGSASPTGGTPGGYTYGPAVILGRARTRRPIVGLVGDSILEGWYDGNPATNSQTAITMQTRGYAERACENLALPMLKVTKPGEKAQDWVATGGHKFRNGVLEGCTHVLCDYGINDLLNSTRTNAQLQADLTTIWTQLNAMGIKVYQATLTPRNNSTDNWTTSVNQSSSVSSGVIASQLAAVNGFIRSSVGGLLAGVLEVGDAVSTARDSGLWKPNASTTVGVGNTVTIDGTHPSAYCHVNTLTPLAQTLFATFLPY